MTQLAGFSPANGVTYDLFIPWNLTVSGIVSGDAVAALIGSPTVYVNLASDNIMVSSSRDFASLGFANIQVSATPLPAALPLFATGLGVMGLLGWLRKRKNATATAA